MTTNPIHSDRRRVLRAAGAAGIGLTAGCTSLGPLGGTGATEDVVLDPPEQYEQLRDARDRGDLGYPIHADPLPEATVPAPLQDRELTTTEFVGERHVLLTFIFTRCPGVCPYLTANLRQVQADAAEEGYADEIALLTATFDPEYDTPERLAAYGEDHNVDVDADNWFFLRPETEERAEAVVQETFGVYFEELSEEEQEEMEMPMEFQHVSMIYLVNADGYVERAYDRNPPNPQDLVEDVHELRERW